MDANQKPAWRRVGEGRPIPGQSYKVLVPGEGGDAPFQEYAQYDTEWWCDSLGRAVEPMFWLDYVEPGLPDEWNQLVAAYYE